MLGVGLPRDAFDIRRLGDQTQPVAQPLHGRARHEDAAFERIGALAAELIGDGGEQPAARMHGHAAGVQKREAAGTVGRLHHAGLDAGLADGGRLLVARHAKDRHRRAQDVGRGDAVIARAIHHLGQHRLRHAQQHLELGIPGALADVEQQAAACVGGVARMDLAAGQAPQQEALDRAEGQRALVGGGAGARDVLQDPGDLGAAEIGIEQQAGLLRDHLLVARLLQPGAHLRRAAILPDDGVVDRLAGRAVPHDGGLALVGDADADEVLRLEFRPGECCAADLDHRRPDLFRIVLDPAGLREDLRQFLLRAGNRTTRGIEHDGAGAGGALVDGEDMSGGCHCGLWAAEISAPGRWRSPPPRASRP